MKGPTFIEYLMELMVSDDPADAIRDVKRAKRDPDRYKREMAAKAIKNKRKIQTSQDDPHKAAKLRIATLQQQLAVSKKRLADRVKQTENQ